MTAEETRALIDCLTHEDCTIRLWGAMYWCLGLTHDERTELWAMGVYECEGEAPVFKRQLFACSVPRKEDCMRHFLSERYWDGKSFYEVASEMEWVDL